MWSGCEKTDDWCWRFGVEMGKGLRERFGRGSLGISEDMCWSAFDDGVEEVVELRYA
jgi:hypothetical protein